jgi:hypothetical protein
MHFLLGSLGCCSGHSNQACPRQALQLLPGLLVWEPGSLIRVFLLLQTPVQPTTKSKSPLCLSTVPCCVFLLVQCPDLPFLAPPSWPTSSDWAHVLSEVKKWWDTEDSSLRPEAWIESLSLSVPCVSAGGAPAPRNPRPLALSGGGAAGAAPWAPGLPSLPSKSGCGAETWRGVGFGEHGYMGEGSRVWGWGSRVCTHG